MPYSLSKLQLAELLSERYPEHKWDKVHLLRGKFAQQKRLERTVASLFPVLLSPCLCVQYKLTNLQGAELMINARKEAELVNPATGQHMELDIYLPAHNLAFEFQVARTLPAAEQAAHYRSGKTSLYECPIYILHPRTNSGTRQCKERTSPIQGHHPGHCAVLVGWKER